MRRELNSSDDDDFTASLLADAGVDAQVANAPSVAPSVEPAASQAQEFDASQAVAGGIPGADAEFDPSLIMAGGVPAQVEAPEQQPALNLQEDPVEQNRQRILRRKRWEALLQPAYWDGAKALLLKKAEQGGLRTDIGISGDVVIFAIKAAGLSALIQPPKIEFDLAKGTIKASGKGMSAQSLAAAYIECGVAAGYKQMWFEGTPDFMRLVTEMAKANGIEVISKAECAAARKLRNLENDESVPAAAPNDDLSFDPVEEEMSTRVGR